MKKQHVDAIKKNLQSLREIDLKADIAECFPDDDIGELSFNEISVLDFISIFERAIRQFEEEIKTDDAIFLPLFFFPVAPNPKLLKSQGLNHNTVEPKDIVDTLANLIQQLKNQDYEASALVLREVISYQRQNGFWDRSERPIHDASSIDIEKIKSEVEATRLHQVEVLNVLKKVSEEYATRTSDLERWANTAKTRLEEATESNSKISELLNTSTAHDAKLDEIVSNQEAVFSDSKETYSSLKGALKEAEERLVTIGVHLDESEKNWEYISGKRDEIKELTGMAGGAALGGKFEARSKVLEGGTQRWLIFIILSVIVSGAWLAFASIYLHAPNEGNAWLAFVWKLGLITPVVFLLGFVGKQYARERTLEEEYAFRAALSMTLNAFGEQLEAVAGNAERKKLITDTVEKLYQSPKSLLSNESSSLPNVRNRSYKEAIETLTATIERLGKINPDA